MRAPTDQQQRALTSDEKQILAQQELATDLINLLCGLDQAGRLYDLNNDTVNKVLKDILATTHRFCALTGERMSLGLVGYSVFINRRLVRLDFSQYQRAQQLAKIWSKLGIGEMSFDEKMTMNGILEFARQLFTAIDDMYAVPALFSRNWGGVTMSKVVGDDSPGERVSPYEMTLRVYSALIVLMRNTIERMHSGKRPPMLRIKRTLQVMVDLLEGHDRLLISLTQTANFKGEITTHLVNTAILSLVVGRRLGLDRGALMGLGAAALFHDLPKLGLKDPTLNSLEQPGAIPAEDRRRVEQRWLSALQRMIDSGRFTDDMLARVVVIYESQLEFTRRDLYSTGDQPPLSLYSQIISVANLFDTITWIRAGKPQRTPHWALLAVLNSAGTAVPVPMVLLFLEAVGLFPTGSLLMLNSGEIGVVKIQNAHGEPEKPVIQVVVDSAGQPIQGGEIDLSHDPRTILWPLNPGPIQINTVNCFLDDSF